MVPVSRYWVKLRRGYFRFPDFWSIPYKKKFQKFHNSRTSDDIDKKHGPVPKLDKRNKRPDFGHRVCKSYVFSNGNLLSYRN